MMHTTTVQYRVFSQGLRIQYTPSRGKSLLYIEMANSR